MIPVQILGVHLEPQTGATLVLLGDGNGANRVLPIFVGPAEATSIAIGLSGEEAPRPLTHDLLIHVVEALQGHVNELRITELRDGTFFAELEMDGPGGISTVSSRPSDGLALAVRLGIPVLVSDEVMGEAAVTVEHEPEMGFEEEEIEEIVSEFRDFLASADPGDFTAVRELEAPTVEIPTVEEPGDQEPTDEEPTDEEPTGETEEQEDDDHGES